MNHPISRRTILAAALGSAVTTSTAWAKNPPKTPRILFVCQFGTVKSPIARELLRRRAAERGILIQVSARGITPQQHLPPELRKKLAADGIDPAAEPLKRLSRRDIAGADLLIAFDPLPPGKSPRRLVEWSDLPSMVGDYPRARAVLDERIDRLLDSLATGR